MPETSLETLHCDVMRASFTPAFTNLEGMRVIAVGHEVMRIIEYLMSNSAEISLLTTIIRSISTVKIINQNIKQNH